MKPWEYGTLTVSENKRYFKNGREPFFWLGDTAWLLFCGISEEEAYVYLKNRADKGYNVIQAVLVYATAGMQDINKMSTKRYDVDELAYWEHCDRILSMAEELGMYIALLPTWGSVVKQGILTTENVIRYAEFLAKRYGSKKNVIWLLGGDIKPIGFEDIYEILGTTLKKYCPNQLIGFHPFGRTSTTMWFNEAKWLDFNMFQSGHRRYDQRYLNTWDDRSDKSEYFGEDNWKYVQRDYALSEKPTLDGEPSYEWILQGLHDPTQPYWVAKDVRRYAYWSVFAGAAGHTYGDNSVMQFFTEPGEGVSYGAKEHWKYAMHHDGSAQMGYLKKLMLSVEYESGCSRDDLVIGGQREKYERIAVFAGKEFLMAYSYSGETFGISTSSYRGMEAYYFRPATGGYSYIGRLEQDEFFAVSPENAGEDKDIVLLLVKKGWKP